MQNLNGTKNMMVSVERNIEIISKRQCIIMAAKTSVKKKSRKKKAFAFNLSVFICAFLKSHTMTTNVDARWTHISMCCHGV